MSRWAQPVKEFHQLITPDGLTYDLHIPSRNGRWVMNSQGWGMPGVDWITQQTPFQHGATVMDFRLQPRIIQLLVRQSFCDREKYWTGREALINALRPNRTPLTFTDYWVPRSQYQGGGIYPSGDDQSSITSLAIFNDLLYGGSGDDGSGTGGLLLVWDGSGSWVDAAGQASATPATGGTYYGTGIEALTVVTMTLPTFGPVLGNDVIRDYYNTNDDGAEDAKNTTWLCQTFTTSEEYLVSRVRAKIYVVGDPGTVTAAIYATDGVGNPTGDPLTSSSIEATSITVDTGGVWVEFGGGPSSSAWTTPNLTLDSGVMYALVLNASSSEAVPYVGWRRDNSGPTYAGGSMKESDTSGATWSDIGMDAMFEVYGRSYTTWKTGEETREILLAGCSNDGIVVPWDGAWLTDSGAQQYSGEGTIYDILQWSADGKVYCAGGGVGAEGLLLRYDISLTFPYGLGSFTLAAAMDSLDPSTTVYCLAVYDDGTGEHIYGGTNTGKLVQWDSIMGSEWDTVTTQANGDQDDIFDIVVHNGYLYGCTGPDGYLVRYDVAGGHWDVVSQSLGKNIKTLIVFKSRLYGAGEDGHLYRWNDVDTWETICSEYIGDGGVAEEVQCSINYNGRLMAGTEDGAYLIEWVRKKQYDRPQCTALRRLLAGGQKRDLCVVIAEGPKYDPDDSGWDQLGFTEMLRFIAYEPTMYDPDMVTVSYLLGTGAISETEIVHYEGTWETLPTLVLYGPLENPIIINENIDEFIALNYTIPVNDIVTINLAEGTIEDNHGVSLLGALTADSSFGTFRLAPAPVVSGGYNTVRIVAGGATGDSDFSLQYYTRYIGI